MLTAIVPLLVADRDVLKPLDYTGVRITGGVFRKQLDEAKEFYLRIPNDDLLMQFRRRAGLPAPGHELGGWYSADVFHIFGQILSGLSRMYKATGDERCREKVEALVSGWAATISPDGYFYATTKPNARHYTYDKMVGGLVDAAIYAGQKEAWSSLAKITNWAKKNLDRTNTYAFNAGEGPTEWYTLSENLYRAYVASGNPQYRDFAKVWEYTDYWKRYADNRDIFDAKQRQYHAYSHVNNLGGAGMAYRVSGEDWYLKVLKNSFDYLQANECMATGGYGPNESLIPNSELEALVKRSSNTFETQCGCWAGFKLSKQLISLTGNAKYGDWVEQLAYNGVASTIPMDAGGRVLYYSNYNPYGARKLNAMEGWTCCAGTRPMAIADVCDLIYFTNPTSLAVSLFIPSVATVSVGGHQVRIEQATRFPERATTSIRIDPTSPTHLNLMIRNPGWLKGAMSASLSGKPVTLTLRNGWAEIDRTWKAGDVLTVNLPMSIRSVPLTKDNEFPKAFAIGPVVLAARSDTGGPSVRAETDLQPILGEPLNYRLTTQPTTIFRPFYEFKEGERYFLYLDPDAAGRTHYSEMKTTGNWRDSGLHYFSNSAGALVEGTFAGDSIELLGYKYDDAGLAEIRVDGKLIETIDQFAPGRDIPATWKFKGFGRRNHSIRITVVHRKADASKDFYVNVAGLRSAANGSR